MNRTVIYKGDDAIDLSSGTVVSTTFKFLDIRNINTRFATFTNQFKLPWTPITRRIYENLDFVKSKSRIPYTKDGGYKVVQNGIELFQNGVGIVKKSFETLNLEIFAGVFGFFDAITGLQLTDLNYLDQNEEPSQVSADNRRANSTNIVFPVIQWGNSLHSVGGQVYNYLPPVGGQYPHLPCFYYFDIMNRIFSEAGYTKSGTIFSNDKYQRTIVTVGNDELYQYSDKFRLAKELLALSPGNQNMNDPAVETNVIFDRVITNGSDNFYNGTDAYTVSNPDTNNQYFSGKFRIKLFLSTTGGTIDIKAYFSGSFNVFATGVTGANSYELEVDPCPMKDGDELRVTIIKNTGNPSVTVVGGSIQMTDADGVVVGGGYIYYNEVLPRLSQKDFISDFCVRFGQIPKPVGKDIIFKSINEIIADRASAFDWTSKRIKRRDETEFVYDDYAQRNIYRYSKSDNTTEITGQGQFDIDNENLDEEIAEEFDFQSSLQTIEAGGLATVNIGVYDSDNPGSSTEEQEYDRAPGNRILLVRDWVDEESVVFQNDPFKPGYDTPRTGYKIAYFDDPKYSNTCSYQQSIDDHYSSLVEALQELKVLIRYYNLNELDIAMLDPHKIMHDGGNDFIILTVSNFVPGIVTKVELLKVR